mmetsp:Transcript_15765/g.34127  ORF Transcript_15765/g.34127 Transcript_15765/m.34127 type:complete len:152 (-) Transcript_15765:1232-1687(-)
MEGGISIGGTKGHIEEVVKDPIFITTYNSFRWKMIPNCTGRYTCRDHKAVSHLTPTKFLEAVGIDSSTIAELQQYYVVFDKEKRKDPIFVVAFADDGLTGIISYVKHQDNDEESISYVHTLNTASGFQRKLEAIHVILLDEYLVDGHDGED